MIYYCRLIFERPILIVLLAFTISAGNYSHSASGKVDTADLSPHIAKVDKEVLILRQSHEERLAQVDERLFSHDRIRTGEYASASIWMGEFNTFQMGELTSVTLLPQNYQRGPLLNLLRGSLYFFSRDKPRDTLIITEFGSAATIGTEFVIQINDDGGKKKVVVEVIDGVAILKNNAGTLRLESGEVGLMLDVEIPPRLAQEYRNIVQWWLYHPVVLDTSELNFSVAELNLLQASLCSYSLGNPSQALRKYPGFPQIPAPNSEAESLYLAGLLLATGQLQEAEGLLENIPSENSLKKALEWNILAVRGDSSVTPRDGQSASEWLGLSYYYQARHELKMAKQSARKAVNLSPHFAPAFVRLAELEFSFGRLGDAETTLNQGMELERCDGKASQNAKANILMGYFAAAEHNLELANEKFSEALELDTRLGTGWLGKGLVMFHMGLAEQGLIDLQMAATLEPERSLFRSYLGKGFTEAGLYDQAEKELTRAIVLDPMDPTPWLYGALLDKTENKWNAALNKLETSIQLNDNRALYRSRFLLDQDRAVRDTNLAEIYAKVDMPQVAVMHAGYAITDDYSNYSSHLFLAESYNALRNPNLSTLRFETATFSEYLLANILSPVGGAPYSSQISNQEYTRLFEKNYATSSLRSSIFSNGDARATVLSGARYGTLSYSLEISWRQSSGDATNTEFDHRSVSAIFKKQISPKDTAYMQVILDKSKYGDIHQYWDPKSSDPDVQVRDRNLPNALFGWHRRWAPNSHTILLFNLLSNKQEVRDSSISVETILEDANGDRESLTNILERISDQNNNAGKFNKEISNDLTVFTTEIQHIINLDNLSFVGGARTQFGDTSTNSLLLSQGEGFFIEELFPNGISQDARLHVRRTSLYSYFDFKVKKNITFQLGVTFDDVEYPSNLFLSPISEDLRAEKGLTPRAGLAWKISPRTTIRLVYAETRNGFAQETSIRLEPTQFSGIPVVVRSLSSVLGAIPATLIRTKNISLDHRLFHDTYVGVQINNAFSHSEQTVGLFEGNFPEFDNVETSSASWEIDFREDRMSLYAYQLMGELWSFTAQYEFIQSAIRTKSSNFKESILPGFWQDRISRLHRGRISINLNQYSGFFAKVESLVFFQENKLDDSWMRSEWVWQTNIEFGFRFNASRGEFRAGIYNLFDDDYRLNPLSGDFNLSRQKLLVFSFMWNY